VLSALGKNMSRRLKMKPTEVNWRAMELLAGSGITIHMSFTLGELSETQESLDNTVEFTRIAVRKHRGSIAMVEAAPMVPLPGSRAWNTLMAHLREHGREHLAYADPARPDEVNEEFIVAEWQANFTKVSKEIVGKAEREIGKIIGEHGVAGNIF
jgi:radical SAM superfamily enzyme YgiQ (UPF0313 family)